MCPTLKAKIPLITVGQKCGRGSPGRSSARADLDRVVLTDPRRESGHCVPIFRTNLENNQLGCLASDMNEPKAVRINILKTRQLPLGGGVVAGQIHLNGQRSAQ